MISVRRTNGLPQASFRFRFTTDTLALLAMCFPLTGALRTFTSKNNVRAGRTESADGEICLKVDTSKGKDAHELRKMLYAWKEQADKLSSEEISKDKYDEWRYHYPEFDTTQIWAKVPSQELSAAMVEAFKDKLKTDDWKQVYYGVK